MANPKHLEILKQGVEAWNNWTMKNINIIGDLCNVNFSGAILTGVNFVGTDLSGANLSHANLIDANLGTDLCRVDFSGANLTGANFVGADLTDANLSGAILEFAVLNGTELKNVNFGGAVLFGTTLGDLDLSQVKNLESVLHNGPSVIGIDCIYASRGNIPEIFLRGCGVPEDFITYIRSLTGEAIEFYTCFISFTEADDTFSERLYNDMQAAGVRCWRWKEDAKWGRTLMRSIDEAVRVYDKLIVICSEQSLNSPAVIREIERALQKEDAAAREGKEAEVLFPIRLDDYIFTGWQHHRKADVVAKNVGDFRNWTEPEEYKKALQRLIRDLKAEARREG